MDFICIIVQQAIIVQAGERFTEIENRLRSEPISNYLVKQLERLLGSGLDVESRFKVVNDLL